MDCDIAENIIEIQDANFRYKGSEEGLLENLSLSVRKGETLLLTGASGSGKTTIIRMINGLIPHYYQGDFDGKVMVSGLDVGQIELYDLAGIVGTVFQNPRSQFFSVDTDGEIVFGPENVGLDPKEILRRKQMVVSQMQIDKLLGRSLFELSGGEKQSIACASVSALLPDIILLDEPSSNLDQEAIEKLKLQIKQWKEQGKTIIISEHRLWYLRDLVDRVIYMEAGKIAHDWTGLEFQAMSNEKARELKLRPLSVPDLLGDKREEKKEKEEKKEVTECEKIHDDVNEAGTSSDNALILKDFYFSYHKKPHLLWKKKVTEQDEQLSLHIPRLELPMGAVIGVVGRNGMGKSTFLKCICGLEKDCKGVIEFEGKEYKAKDRLKLCYMVMQDVNHQLFTDSVEAEVLLSMKESSESKQENRETKGITSDESKRITKDDCKGKLSGNREEVCNKILDELGILPYKDKHPMALSGGQKQRVAIASAMAADAKLLLFDEPTSGLDFAHMEKVGTLFKQLAASGRTVLVVTHDPELIELSCDYLLCIKNGSAKYIKKVEKAPSSRYA